MLCYDDVKDVIFYKLTETYMLVWVFTVHLINLITIPKQMTIFQIIFVCFIVIFRDESICKNGIIR